MAFTDLFKTRRSAKLHQSVWQAVWPRLKTSAEGDAAARELHVIFVGTVLYATRCQAALTAGMAESSARAVALQVVAQAGFDEDMRDRVLAVFAPNCDPATAQFASQLRSLVAALVTRVGDAGGGAAPEELLDELVALMPSLAALPTP